jgi:serine/threonine protein kinase
MWRGYASLCFREQVASILAPPERRGVANKQGAQRCGLMDEQQLFISAVEIEDAAARAAFLDHVCGDDACLRRRVEVLLEEQTGEFLKTPALLQIIGGWGLDADMQVGKASGQRTGASELLKYLEPATRPGWVGRLAHYEIEAILGCGAFGIVAAAFDDKLQRVVAIKILRPELATTSPPRKRFLREARSAAAIAHENIVTIHAVEESPIPYLVMEYVPGQTLQQRIDQTGPLDVTEVLRIGKQIAAGLAVAHANQLIHRDIKPANILLTGGPNDRVKISDFGLARAVDDATLTTSGVIAGTPMYMAPEHARGETLDHRADLFSLGSVLYQMVGGRPPFRAPNAVAVLKRVCEDTPRSLRDILSSVPSWLEAIIFRLLKKDRKDRYQSAQEVSDLLGRCLADLERKQHEEKVSGLCSGELSSEKMPSWEDQNVQTKRVGWVTP